MSDLFKKATKQDITYNTSKGVLTLNDLWKIPLESKSTTAITLDSILVSLDTELRKETTSTSFISKTSSSSSSKVQLAFDVAHEILKERLVDKKALEETLVESQRKARIKELIAEKKEDNLKNLSIEELEKLA